MTDEQEEHAPANQRADAVRDDRQRTGSRIHPIPNAESFVFARWAELTATEPPPEWWTRPAGVGLRLRLHELAELAAARASGGITKQAIAALIKEAQRVLFAADSYCNRRFSAAVDAVRASLRDDAADLWVPEAAGPSSISAALDLIDTPTYLPQLIADIAADAAAINTLDDPTRAADAMSALETLVELLDDELVYDGHSLAWRQNVCNQARARCCDTKALDESISAALADNGHGDRRRFDAFVPVIEYEEPSAGRLGLEALRPTDALATVISKWMVEGLDLERPELQQAERLLRFRPEAADVDAAARIVSHEYERDAGLWNVRDGRVRADPVVLIYDPRGPTARYLPLPTEPLDVRPRRLGMYAPEIDNPGTSVDDALVQLAQARTAPPATAIVNLWTASEALFAGVVGETRGDAASVMAGLAEFLYLLDLLAWLGDRYSAAEFEGAPPGGSSRWGFERTLEKTTEVLDRLAERDDVLAWWRLKTITAWTDAPRFRKQLRGFGERMEQIGNRTYLVRNAVIHSGWIRRAALEVTLPSFAGLVRENVGYVANTGPADQTLRTAIHKAIVVRHLANQITSKEVTPADGIDEVLPDEPGWAHDSDAAAPPDRKPESQPGEPVSVEELDAEDAPDLSDVGAAEQPPGGESSDD